MVRLLRRRWAHVVLATAVIGWWAIQAAAYAAVWRSPLLLAAHTAAHAPYKPRPLLNLGSYLASSGRLEEALAATARAEQAVALPHVRSWDRRRMMSKIANNKRGIEMLIASRSGVER